MPITIAIYSYTICSYIYPTSSETHFMLKVHILFCLCCHLHITIVLHVYKSFHQLNNISLLSIQSYVHVHLHISSACILFHTNVTGQSKFNKGNYKVQVLQVNPIFKVQLYKSITINIHSYSNVNQEYKLTAEDILRSILVKFSAKSYSYIVTEVIVLLIFGYTVAGRIYDWKLTECKQCRVATTLHLLMIVTVH